MGLAIGGEGKAACMLGAGMVKVSATTVWLHDEGQHNNVLRLCRNYPLRLCRNYPILPLYHVDGRWTVACNARRRKLGEHVAPPCMRINTASTPSPAFYVN